MVSPITERARKLRNNPTEAEKKLWQAIKKHDFDLRFRRQYPIGPYFADIACKEKMLVIEIDGGQHSELSDRNRTNYIEAKDFRIIRFWNNDVLGNIEGVMTEITKALNAPPLPPRTRGGIQEDC